jgi:GDP/UDP-N,N'-diacetylbacillosamine 2-epimerase (hydrolysing)
VSVIDCQPERESITFALQRLYSPAFQETLKTVHNPYGEGGASEKIVQILCEHPLDSILKKTFHDVAY